MNWQAVSAAATFFAALVALGLGVWPILKEKRRRERKATMLRRQLLTQLSLIEDVLHKRIATPCAYEYDWVVDALEVLWGQADLLEEDEFASVCGVMGRLIPLKNATLASAQAQTMMALVHQTPDILAQRLVRKPYL